MNYKRWLFVAILLFIIGIILGIVVPAGVVGLDLTALAEQFSSILTLPKFLIAIIILVNNVVVLLMSFLFSPILCLLPILALVANGWLLAFVSAAVIREESLGLVLAGLLPHGIFELPALIMGEAAALSFGAAVVLALLKKERRTLLLPSLKQNLRYLMIALALLVPAAIIETYVTPLLIT